MPFEERLCFTMSDVVHRMLEELDVSADPVVVDTLSQETDWRLWSGETLREFWHGVLQLDQRGRNACVIDT